MMTWTLGNQEFITLLDTLEGMEVTRGLFQYFSNRKKDQISHFIYIIYAPRHYHLFQSYF